jgi:hypothetical protein
MYHLIRKDLIMEKIKKIESIAKVIADGHFTIMKFGSNYRAGYGTNGERQEISRMRSYRTFDECINGLLSEGQDELNARLAEGTIDGCVLNKINGWCSNGL